MFYSNILRSPVLPIVWVPVNELPQMTEFVLRITFHQKHVSLEISSLLTTPPAKCFPPPGTFFQLRFFSLSKHVKQMTY